MELDQFARRLHGAMVAKGWSNSDLARAVWGETTDNKGYKVARNRDRIAVYLKAEGFPEPATLAKLAEVLGVPKDELSPEMAAAQIDKERPEFAMTVVAGHHDRVHLQLNAILPLSAAVEISRIYEQAKTAARHSVPGVDTDLPEGQ